MDSLRRPTWVDPAANTVANAKAVPSSISTEKSELRLLPQEGIGLHTGLAARLHYRGALSRSDGIRFSHVDADGNEYSAPALWTRLSATARSTSLVLRGPTRRRFELKTVEHLLAALFAAGFPAGSFELEKMGHHEEGSEDLLEVPVLDGSSLLWTAFLRPLVKEVSELPVWIPARSFQVVDGARSVLITPSVDAQELGTTEFRCSVDFGEAWKQESQFLFDWSAIGDSFERFAREIAPARTFGFAHELKALSEKRLAMGGSLENALLLDGDRIVNPGGFRVPNELAAHKLMDAVGDFALLGAPILGCVHVVKAGHSMHLRTLEEAVRTGALVRGRLLGGRQVVRDDG